MPLTEKEVSALPLGARVVFPDGASAYPDFNITDRLTGTVCDKQPDSVWVRIDQPHSDLAEWGNMIQFWLWGDDAGHASYDVERLFSCERPDELSGFINAYCLTRGITVDGDAFGIAFSAVSEEWTTDEAIRIIEHFADIYGLRLKSETFTVDTTQDREGNAMWRAAVADADGIFNEDIFYSEAEAREWVAANHPEAVQS